MPAGYGTAAYYRELDRQAPSVAPGWLPSRNPVYLMVYPFGYYALLALWLAPLGLLAPGSAPLFFGARLFSVLLLAVSLALTYAVARELRVPPRRALLLTTLVGSFPLVTFVASYAQPDTSP